MRHLHLLLLATALAGCAGPPLGQGGNAEIVSAGDEMIRIRWNPQRTSERDMRSRAMAFCEGRRVEALEASSPADTAAGLQARTWRCDPFPGTGAGM